MPVLIFEHDVYFSLTSKCIWPKLPPLYMCMSDVVLHPESSNDANMHLFNKQVL